MDIKGKYLSQNFLRSPRLVEKLIEKAKFNNDDLVLEIGPGKGIITDQLSSKVKNVIAIEKDNELVLRLKSNFSDRTNISIELADFLEYNLPTTDYKIFSNIPFNITSDIVRKILNSNNPPIECFLIMQLEAAFKYSGRPYSAESMFSLLYKPDFDFEIIYHFDSNDFYPTPSVQVVLLKITKRKDLLIQPSMKKSYSEFINYSFSRRKPNVKLIWKDRLSFTQITRLSKEYKFNIKDTLTDLSIQQWLGIFEFYQKFNINNKIKN